jgi:phospholipid N-methyltransferase
MASFFHQIRFLSNFLRHPTQVGAVAPSSGILARMMVDWIEWQQAKVVLEFGPGTGVFTEEILRSLRPDTKFLAIERAPEFAEILRHRFPTTTIVEDSVENIQSICRNRGIEQVDAILCGLPWAAFSDVLQTSCLEAMRRILRPGGQFATFAYWQGVILPAGIKFRRRLGAYFEWIERSPTVWRNIPPAFVYRCRSAPEKSNL